MAEGFPWSKWVDAVLARWPPAAETENSEPHRVHPERGGVRSNIAKGLLGVAQLGRVVVLGAESVTQLEGPHPDRFEPESDRLSLMVSQALVAATGTDDASGLRRS